MSAADTRIRKRRYLLWRSARVISQLFFLLLFFFLFIKTDYTGSDTLEYAVNILFRIDPLLAISTMLATKTIIALMVPALVVIVVSLIVGRAFCGWFCPLGTLLDLWHKLVKTRTSNTASIYPNLAKLLLVFILISAVLGVPLAGYLDPFSILVRGLSLAVYPGINDVSVAFFSFTYEHGPPAVNAITEPLYELLQSTILPLDQKYYTFGLISLLILALVFVVEFWQRRFFCRNICPLGALLGWCARLGLMKLAGGDTHCGRCHHCQKTCRMGAINDQRHINVEACTLCMDCFVQCPRQIISFQAALPVSRGTAVSLSRRQFIGSVSAALVLPAVLGTRTLAKTPEPLLIRPPGALAEQAFLQRCIRCGQCMQVCITNGLQPTLLQAGIEGVFSPYLAARSGYCEFNCTMCGQVCPTGAIGELTIAEKHGMKIGHAWFDKNICLPFAKGIPCIVCEEHCPTPEKAIKFKHVRITDGRGVEQNIKQPYLVDELCIGCGICETKCPLPGRSGIFVTSAGEHRNPDSELPTGNLLNPYSN